MFEKLIKDITTKEEPEKKIINIMNNPHMNKDFFKYKIDELPKLSEEELFNIINSCIDDIVSDIITEKYEFLSVFLNGKFLNQFCRVIGTIPITEERKKCCSKIAYDYIILSKMNKNEYMIRLYRVLVKLAFRDIIPILQGIGIPEQYAIDMVMARYSSEKEIINSLRLNFVIINSPINIMTEQNIVLIYEKLFDRITGLFKGTMFDILNEEEEWINDDIIEINSRVTSSVLIILNNMTLVDIRKVLIDYTGDFYNIKGGKSGTYRVSMVALSNDYSRIVQVAEQLRQEGYYVP